MTDRKCGGCTACCEALEVKEIEKPERTRCPNQKRMGCAVYADRPQSCRDYSCVWLAGLGSTAERPDRTGVVISSFGTDDRPTMMIHELRAGAAETRLAKRAKEVALEKGARVVTIRKDGMRNLIDPRSLVR